MRGAVMEEELQAAVQDYLQNGDSQLLVVAFSQFTSTGHSGGVASFLLQLEQKEIVRQLGWELLGIIVPHLPSSTTSPEWALVSLIAQTCSPKEMCLAFLEQLEVLSQSAAALAFPFLRPLCVVLQRLGLKGDVRLVSSLRAVHEIVGSLYSSLEEGREEEKGHIEEEGEEDLEEEERKKKGDITVSAAVDCVVELVEPFVASIHQQCASSEVPLLTSWTPLQRECVSLLLALLDQPLVSCDLRRETAAGDLVRATESILSGVVRCHCGCLQLLEREREVWRGKDSDEEPSPLPLVGVACFSYLMLAEGLHSTYLPTPIHPYHLLHVTLTHTITLLLRHDWHSIMKGLALLKAVLSRVSLSSLPAYCLDSRRYLKTAECLVDIMVTGSHKDLRQQCVSLLPELIQRFSDSGRHRLYRSLLHTTGHAGVQGLLIQSIKNEVAQALSVCSPQKGVSSPFLGSELVPLLDKTITFSADEELLSETDRVMAGLNFLRYLLIRDQPADNRTGVWDEVDRVRSKFIQPLREVLETNKLQCRGEMERVKGAGPRVVSGEDEPEVTVEVMGEKFSDVSPQDELKMLQLAEYQLDMMEGVLVRVEELLDNS